MMKVCERCGGAIMAAGVTYGYAGPVCACVWVQPAPAPDKAAWQRSYEREISDLENEIERLRGVAEDAANRIRRCDYTMARSVLLEALKAPNVKVTGAPPTDASKGDDA